MLGRGDGFALVQHQACSADPVRGGLVRNSPWSLLRFRALPGPTAAGRVHRASAGKRLLLDCEYGQVVTTAG